MEILGSARNTKELLEKYQFTLQKKYGQNFLIDRNILEKIVDAAQITGEDYVLEIGPGIGTMTQYLAERAKLVLAVEIDKNLIPILQDTLGGYPNVTVLNADILKVDIRQLMEGLSGGKPVKVVANLPYYITTPIIMTLFESHIALQSITIMVQKEVADRMQAKPGSKDYGALSLAVQYYAKPEVITRAPASCFLPKPNVDSTVIRLTRYGKPPVEAQDEAYLFAVIRAAFNQRRKTLINSLANAENLHIAKEKSAGILRQMGLLPTIRGEALTLEQFTELSNSLHAADA
ncbi:MAG: 16S rRNA (adenine(1518)-N(6)/adenine(1519)-N(6))-dimethyltransferase RsmA [Blautia sp.]|nr:16S rRNA (adenine(1518)-N(6)/adenine(1519)-N(6))-dimethyltransferase RsmA [Lachnoclostridium sp.]MCM1211586.1 16S rRNA (adenine(1518)-N(6)/adenine(1519)-N(6))-dimethyltransferase RsmA [Blautia sp.]